MGYKSEHSLCLSRTRDVSVWPGSGLILNVQAEHHFQGQISASIPPYSCSPFPGNTNEDESWRSRICEVQSAHMPHNVITATRMCSCWGGSCPFSMPDHCKISFWEDSASHLFLLGLSMLPPPISFAKF